MTWPTTEWVANRAAALNAYMTGEPDSVAWLEATGLTRPHQRQETGATWTTCTCPFCQQRPCRPVDKTP
jgi:hypothetical protein